MSMYFSTKTITDQIAIISNAVLTLMYFQLPIIFSASISRILYNCFALFPKYINNESWQSVCCHTHLTCLTWLSRCLWLSRRMRLSLLRGTCASWSSCKKTSASTWRHQVKFYKLYWDILSMDHSWNVVALTMLRICSFQKTSIPRKIFERIRIC